MTDAVQELLGGIEDGSIADKLSAPLSVGEIDALVERAAADPGVPFESQTLARIAATKSADLAGFMRLYARLKAAKIKVGALDRVTNAIGAASSGEDDDGGGQGRAIAFHEIEPWPEPVDGAVLLDQLVAQIERHVMLPRESAVSVALWITHAHRFDAFSISPRLVITSPEKRRCSA
jgi:hypothetical protein